MAWQQWRQLANGEVQSSDDATYTLELPRNTPIHSLWLKTECTNGATSAQGLDITDVVDLVEVIANGSEVLLSLNADDLELWGMLALGRPVPQENNEAADAVQMAMYPLMFGRRMFDPNMYIPANRFSDLELRVRYSPAIAATSFATGTTTFTVLGLVTHEGEPGAYQGTLKTTNVSNFTSAASGEQRIQLPRRNKYHRVLVHAYEAAIESGVDITQVRLELNTGQRVILDMDWDNLEDLNQAWFNLYPERHAHLFRADTDTVDTRISQIQHVSLSPLFDVNITNDTIDFGRVDTIAGDRLTLNVSRADVTAGAEDLTALTTDDDYLLRVLGRGLPNSVVIPFDLMAGMEMFDSSQWDDVDLILTQGGAGATVRTSLQEVLTLR